MQQPQPLQVLQAAQVLLRPLKMASAHIKFCVGSHGALPLLHEGQLMELIWNRPTSSEPLLLPFMALALPPDS